MRQLKVYLAAPFQQQKQMQLRAAELRAVGIQVTSRWLEEQDKPMGEIPGHIRRINAIHDVEDVIAADMLVFHDDPTIQRAGRHVEFGIAVGIGTTRSFPILVLGPPNNIFHYLAQVYHFDSWADLKANLIHISKLGTMTE